MTQLRWLVTTYPEPTQAAVNELWGREGGISKVEAYRQLKKPKEKVLQYLNDNQGWVDVPTVTVIGETI